jgi:DNA-binding NtrC family response regulator
MRVIVIEDEKTKRITLTDALKKTGHDTEAFEHPVPALQYVERHGADVVVTDFRLPGMNGIEVLERIKKLNPQTTVVVMTAYGTVESAVQAMKLGAYDYIMKPFSSERLLLILEKLEAMHRLVEENRTLKQKLQGRYSFHSLIGKSKVMGEIYDQIETIAKTDATVLIEGESGTGKELVANAIHYNSARRNGPFIKLSCAVLSDSLLESELFGHEKGAFTGALKERKGRFELADGGTLFLDDVDDIPISSQVKLLRVLQEREFERVGGTRPLRVDVRLICATKKNLQLLMEEGKFREDLFYRLNVLPIKLPPLRERKEDIPLLVGHFLKMFNKPTLRFSPEAIEQLVQLDWPGNVRQLENLVQRMAALANGDVITKEMLPPEINKEKRQLWNFNGVEALSLDGLIEEMEKGALQWALKKAGGNQTEAATFLSLSRTTFRDKLKKYGLS